jgi:hypothetical protein
MDLAFYGVQIGVANATSQHLQPHLPGTRLGYRQLDEFQAVALGWTGLEKSHGIH